MGKVVVGFAPALRGRGPRIVSRAICHKTSHKWEQRRRLCVCDATAHVGVERAQRCSTNSLEESLACLLSCDGRSHPRDGRVNSRIRAYTHMSAIARRVVWAGGELSDGYRHGEVPENRPRNFDRDASRSLELPICSGLFQPRLLSDLQHPTRMVCQGCLGERVRPQNKGRNPARRRRQKAACGRRLEPDRFGLTQSETIRL